MVVPETVFTRSGLKPGPIPPNIALDMVQDATDDRDAAVAALAVAAAGAGLDAVLGGASDGLVQADGL